MSSVTVSMPSASATRLPRRRLSGSESRSGISTPSTFFGPSAATASAAETLESMPPERPSTMPRRRSRFSTCSRIASAMRATSAVASRRSQSSPSCGRRARVEALDAGTMFIAPPLSSLAAISRRSILPFSDFGSALSNATAFGTMKSSRCLAQWRITSSRPSATPGSSATTALIAWPSIGSGTPTTAASRTPGSA